MTSTAVLRTPPAPTSYRGDYISLRRPRETKDKGFGRVNTPSPTTSVVGQRVKSLSDRTYIDSPTHPSPSPLRKRVLFERGSRGQRDSDDDDEASPSTSRLHSPFTSHCASSFLRAWGGQGSKSLEHSQPVEDDEGLFLACRATPTHTPFHSSFSRGEDSNLNTYALNTPKSGYPKLILTPSPKMQTLPTLSPIAPPRFASRTPQTPAEADWHLGKQTESMTKLSLDDEHDDCSVVRNRSNVKTYIDRAEDLSPSLVPKRRGRKRSFDGNELPRSKGGIFETSADSPVTISFQVPESPSPLTRNTNSTTTFFGPTISPPIPSKRSFLGVTTDIVTSARSRSSSPKLTSEPLAKKYRPRDSGVAGLDDDDDDSEGAMDTLVSMCTTIPDEETSGLVTPGLQPPSRSAWPKTTSAGGQPDDEFIFTALAAGGAPKDKKIMPDTPVKPNAYAHSRPWMSSSKVMPPPAIPCARGAPRKSLPLSFPNLSQIQNSPDDTDASPTDRPPFANRKLYGEIGRGRANMLLSRGGGEGTADSKTKFLMRRSSSGAYSSNSSSDGSLLGTPTKLGPLDSQPSCMKTNNPSTSSQAPKGLTPFKRTASNRHGPSPRPLFSVSPRPLTEYERPGKFEVEFLTVDNLGTGEFGSAIKVRYKQGDDKDVFAIKKSKRFEGVKHRRRLREEVDILKHLASIGGPRGHPNVLKYIDSWEQDDVLYIQTEICELGNLGTFLGEYGAHFGALDEARVWKIYAELSNGLRFIHLAGVIHLDLKPDNVFVTSEGRFQIGDFGMASLWPRRAGDDGFEREGDREYMAPEILQGRYGKEADVFSLGMIMLETAANIVVPDMGDEWHRLREDDFSAVDFSAPEGASLTCPRSAELIRLIMCTMRSNQDARLTIEDIYNYPIVQRAREAMERKLAVAIKNGTTVFAASPLGGEPEGYMQEVLQLAGSGLHVT